MTGGELPVEAGGLLAGFAAGSRVAGYVLEERIGAGGMAVVFRARDERLGRRVALKILAPALAADQAFRHRFIRESRAAAAVDDPHIVPVFEAGEADGVLFIAMRYVPGGDVRTLVRRVGPLSPGRAAAIISSVASALDAAHGAGLVHRDVKPANMLVDARPGRPDHVYLSDFGLSKDVMSSLGLTGSGHFLGTPGYTAPEQMAGKPVGGRADQYSLACAAFELLCGETPFPRDQVAAVIWAHMSEPPPPLTSRRPGLPSAVDGVLARALAKAPGDRYASCQGFADALRGTFGLAPYNPGSRGIPQADHPRTETAWPVGSRAAEEGIPAAVLAEAGDSYGAGHATRPSTSRETATSGPAARRRARHARASLPALPAAGPEATAAPSSPAAAGPDPRQQPGAGAAPAGTHLHERSGLGLTRRKLLLAGTACSSAAVVGGILWERSRPGPGKPASSTGKPNSHTQQTGPGTAIWRSDIGEMVTSLAVADGAVYIAAGSTKPSTAPVGDRVYALNADTGVKMWTIGIGPVRRDHSSAGPVLAVAGGVVCAGSDDRMYALRASDGTKIWTFPRASGMPVMADAVVYAVGGGGGMCALRTSDGARIWNSSPMDVSSGPVVGGVIYAAGEGVYALRASNGTTIWSLPWQATGLSYIPPVVAGDVVCISGFELYALRTSDGSKKWSFSPRDTAPVTASAAAGDAVYIGLADGNVDALVASDGTKIWSFLTDGAVYIPPVVADGIVYAAGRTVFALRSTDGSETWNFPIPVQQGPVVAAGVVYLAGTDGYVYALRT